MRFTSAATVFPEDFGVLSRLLRTAARLHDQAGDPSGVGNRHACGGTGEGNRVYPRRQIERSRHRLQRGRKAAKFRTEPLPQYGRSPDPMTETLASRRSEQGSKVLARCL